jgi:16S rRNA (guanine527-N7)-methyltransferase
MDYRSYPDFGLFEEGLSALGINLNDLQKQQFTDYYEMLVEWNKDMNLTAITKYSEVIQKHFLDSLSIVKIYQPVSERILDMGTGAGFPGIPIKIVFPDTRIVLLDSLNKRIHFLEEVIKKLNLSKITAVHGRAEDFGRDKEYRETFGLCVSRAVANLSTLSEYCLPYVKKGGYFIAYKSGKAEEELNEAANAIKLLGAALVKSEHFTLPGTDMERALIMMKKESVTSGRYPRGAGKPAKEPL